MKRFAVVALLCAACASSSKIPDSEQYLPPDVEAMSLLGKPLSAPALAADIKQQREQQLAQAQRDYESNPESADAIIWLGRRLAYLGRYRDAIAAFSEGIRKFPDDARFYRHRGHRYVSVRRFSDAVHDLEFAAILERGKTDQVEPDGLPNARNIPLGSLQSNIFYHLGLAYYLQGDFDRALTAYRQCLALAKNPDRLVATTYWMYMTLRRLGRVQEAEKLLEPISVDLDVIEDVAYHKLLLMYEGEIAPEELVRQDPNSTDGATTLYGIGNWWFINGQPERALPLWKKVLEGNQTFAFGYVAAEAELARRQDKTPAASAASSRTTGYFPVKHAVQ